MDDQRTAEGLEHLQAAANELLAAARSFLDVAEDVISDPDRFGGVAAGAVDMIKGFTGKGQQPWERHAWDVDGDGDGNGDDVDTAGAEPAGEAASASEAEPGGEAVDSDTGSDAEAVDDSAPAASEKTAAPVKPKPRARAAKKPAAGRVKRIAVD